MSTPKLCLVIDVEATCWEGNPPSGVPVKERKNEIIEIGITPVDMSTREIGESESIIVWPTTTDISPFCTVDGGEEGRSVGRLRVYRRGTSSGLANDVAETPQPFLLLLVQLDFAVDGPRSILLGKFQIVAQPAT